MKKLILLLTILCAIPFTGFAQQTGEAADPVDCAAIVDGQGKQADVNTPTTTKPESGKETNIE